MGSDASRAPMCKPARSFPRTAQNDNTKLLQFTPCSCESIYMPTSSHNTKKMALHNCSSRGNNNSMTIDINHTDPSWCKPLCKRNNSRPQKKVTFCPLVTVNTFPTSFLRSREILSADSEQQLQKAMTRRKGKDAQDKTTPTVNPGGKVRIERRIQQRTAIMAVLSYQRRLQERIAGVAPSFEFTLLLSPISLKLSQRAKDIALETARQTFLEVYAISASASYMVPIHVSEFPEIKKKKKREHPGDFVCNPPPKRQA